MSFVFASGSRAINNQRQKIGFGLGLPGVSKEKRFVRSLSIGDLF